MTAARLRATERDFQRAVTDLADLLGWQWAHFRPAQTSRGWRTPVSGPLGKGWPDLVLVRGRRIIFAELKRDDAAKLTPDQMRVLSMLMETASDDALVEAFVWRPSGIDNIAAVLR